jgi:hypothetical protein
MKIDARLLLLLSFFATLFVVGQIAQQSEIETLKTQVRDCQTK